MPAARIHGDSPRSPRVPLDQIANPTVLLLVEPLLGGLPVTRVLLSLQRVGAAQHGGVQLEQVLEIAHGEGIDPARDERIDQLVAGDHVARPHRRPSGSRGGLRRCVDAREIPLDAAQRRLDGLKVEPSADRSRGGSSRG